MMKGGNPLPPGVENRFTGYGVRIDRYAGGALHLSNPDGSPVEPTEKYDPRIDFSEQKNGVYSLARLGLPQWFVVLVHLANGDMAAHIVDNHGTVQWAAAGDADGVGHEFRKEVGEKQQELYTSLGKAHDVPAKHSAQLTPPAVDKSGGREHGGRQ